MAAWHKQNLQNRISCKLRVLVGLSIEDCVNWEVLHVVAFFSGKQLINVAEQGHNRLTTKNWRQNDRAWERNQARDCPERGSGSKEGGVHREPPRMREVGRGSAHA